VVADVRGEIAQNGISFWASLNEHCSWSLPTSAVLISEVYNSPRQILTNHGVRYTV